MKILTAFACLSLLTIAPLRAQTWSVAYLHPTGATFSGLNATTGTQQVGDATIGGVDRAGLWSGTAASFTDLHPGAIADHSSVTATSGSHQVGYFTIAGKFHAATWAGTAASFEDLHPAGAIDSFLYATTGSQQAGYVTFTGKTHAGLWADTALSFIDLTPDAVTTHAYINAAISSQQAGSIVKDSISHAVVWAGAPGSLTDLHPSTVAIDSALFATSGSQQAGTITVVGGDTHAAIWAGTVASFRDIHPAGVTYSSLAATTGTRQAGRVLVNGNSHAGIWSGTAASFIDLHAFLTATYSESVATGIWSDGSTVLVAGRAYNKPANRYEAVLWKLTPNRLPAVRISGKKRLTVYSPRLKIKGSASDADGGALRIEVKVGKAKYKKAKGAAKWKFTAHLQPGKNKILVHAVDTAGASSPPVKLTIIRK